MKDQFKKLRGTLGLTLNEFARIIGVTQSTFSKIENGKSVPSVQLIKSVCNRFHVREDWLRYGTGDMFLSTDGQSIDALASEFDLDELDLRIVSTYARLPIQARAGVKAFIRGISSELMAFDDSALGEVNERLPSEHPYTAEQEDNQNVENDNQ